MNSKSHQGVDMADLRSPGESGSTVKLGDLLATVADERIAPERARFQAVVEQWAELLPYKLCQHSKVASMRGGRLTVLVDGPAYMYELQLRSARLIEKLQQRCPCARITTIKLTVG